MRGHKRRKGHVILADSQIVSILLVLRLLTKRSFHGVSRAKEERYEHVAKGESLPSIILGLRVEGEGAKNFIRVVRGGLSIS